MKFRVETEEFSFNGKKYVFLYNPSSSENIVYSACKSVTGLKKKTHCLP